MTSLSTTPSPFPPALKALGIALFLLLPFLTHAEDTQPSVPKNLPGPEYVNTWLVLSGFENDAQDTGFQRAWIDETTTQAKEGDIAAGKPWRYFDDRLFSRNYDNYQDLWSYFRLKRGESLGAGQVVYAQSYVYSEKAQPAVIYVGADQKSRTWLNGRLVLETGPGQWARDSVQQAVELSAGWNRILVKVANQGDRRLGFYLRISDAKGQRLKGLTWSVQGEMPQFAVVTRGMSDLKTGDLPTGWREWSYISAQPNPRAIFPKGSEADERRHLLARLIQDSNGSIRDPKSILQAGEFRLQAQGGQPPYRWTVLGDLPPGLEVAPDGTILGTVADYAEARTYRFTVRAKDTRGQVVKKDLAMEVKERPNKWYEQSRLVSLIHAPEHLEENKIETMVDLMRRQGFQVGMPISYNNGEMAFRWPSRFAPPGTRDTVGKFKAAFQKNGLRFGMYMGNLNRETDKRATFRNEEQHIMLEEALRLYHPKALWFDWSTIEAEAIDSLYSMIRSYDPEIVIIINGSWRGTFGDWDSICFEGWSAWGWNMWDLFPVDIPWPKKVTQESWRLLTEPGLAPGINLLPGGPALNTEADWAEYLRVQLSLIGEGFVANIDHTHSLRLGKKSWDQPMDAKPVPYDEAPLIKSHELMADWASPAGLPPLYTSYTQVNPGPLEPGTWGYNLINVNRDAIYLHLIKNPLGKTGLPREKSITVGPIDAEVAAVTWMNKNQPLKFQQELTSTNKYLTIPLAGVTEDPIDTIFRIQLKKPLPLPRPTIKDSIPPGNLASFKPTRMLGAKGFPLLVPSKGFVASFGVDGNPNTISVGGGEWSWIYEADLLQVHPITRIVVRFGERHFATESDVLVSADGIDWEQAGTDKRDTTGVVEYTFPAKDARYIRVRGLKPDDRKQLGGQMGIAELQVFE